MIDKNVLYATDYLISIYFGIGFSSSSEEIIDAAIEHAYTDAVNMGAFNRTTRFYIDEEGNCHSSNSNPEEKELVKRKIKDCHDEAKTFLKSQIDQAQNGFANQEDFSIWHYKTREGLCLRFKDIHKIDKQQNVYDSFTHGNAQKWLNMSIKNMYSLFITLNLFSEKSMLIKEEKYLNQYRILFSHPEFFHIPVDRYIVRESLEQGIINDSNKSQFLIDEKYRKKLLSDCNSTKGFKKYYDNYIKKWSNWDSDTYEKFIKLMKETVGNLFEWEQKAWFDGKKKENED